MGDAFQMGLAPDAFWRMTPYQLVLAIRAHARRERERYRLAGWTSWHTAALGRAKRLPPLRTMIEDKDTNDRTDVRELRARMDAMVARQQGTA